MTQFLNVMIAVHFELVFWFPEYVIVNPRARLTRGVTSHSLYRFCRSIAAVFRQTRHFHFIAARQPDSGECSSDPAVPDQLQHFQ